jgi:hypothetical protein
MCAPSSMTPWNDLLDDSPPERHLVQCYGDEAPLIRNVTRYFAEGLQRGEGALAIATPEHRLALVACLNGGGVDAAAAERQGQLQLLDAQEVLDRILVDGEPDAAAFDRAVRPAVSRVRNGARTGVRAYGEMVGLLWSAWRFAGAVRLEALWNRLLVSEAISLFCAYPIDVMGPDFDPALVHAILCAHTHLVPAAEDLYPSLDRALEEVVGPGDRWQPPRYAGDPRWAALPPTEAKILWIRGNLPNEADRILARARRRPAAPATRRAGSRYSAVRRKK